MTDTDEHDGRARDQREFAARQPTKDLRILIADDDPDTLELVRLALRSPRIDIWEATNGAVLLQILGGRHSFDAIVADIQMPWMDGLRAVELARKFNIQTPVLVITGRADPDLQRRVERLDGARLLRKPFGILELRVALADLVGETL
jgi:CheY-like chemotaxis protein